ncbi:MAG: hypothetical protein GY696_37980 [Gammaproteobacteria bacterium]|nr:hypothetical protein [Gammaproteobacteria bacterium]
MARQLAAAEGLPHGLSLAKALHRMGIMNMDLADDLGVKWNTVKSWKKRERSAKKPKIVPSFKGEKLV